jgi:hypothetical protein
MRITAACRLDAAIDLPARLAEWRAVAGTATARVDVEGATRLDFAPAPGLVARLAALVDAEVACCAFFAFDLAVTATSVGLTIGAPDPTAVAGLLG